MAANHVPLTKPKDKLDATPCFNTCACTMALHVCQARVKAGPSVESTGYVDVLVST